MVTENYRQVCAYLEARYPEIDGYNFYRDIFPDNENAGELHEDFSHPNAIYLYKDEQDPKRRALRRRIMLNDTWEEDYTEFVEENPMTLCSGLTYHSRANRLKDAQCMNALIFDLDGVGLNEIQSLFLRFGGDPNELRRLPMPTYLVASGSGLHIYYVFDKPSRGMEEPSREIGDTDTETLIREARAGIDSSRTREENSGADRADREAERSRQRAEAQRRAEEAKREAEARQAQRRARSRSYGIER